jgi:glycosyltransferase involved in cell wall biosynthesis
MAAGLPVVATNVGGTPEAVQDGKNGLLIPPGDPCAIADAVCRFLDDRALSRRLGNTASRSVAERYSMLRVAESTTRIYESMLENTRPAAARQSLKPV